MIYIMLIVYYCFVTSTWILFANQAMLFPVYCCFALA